MIPYGMSVPVAVWRLSELLYPCNFTLLTYLFAGLDDVGLPLLLLLLLLLMACAPSRHRVRLASATDLPRTC